MEKLVDYVKYTVALAIGLLVYIPTNFLPTENSIAHWLLGLTVAALGVSALAGILMYTRATKLIIEDQTKDPKFWLGLWGNLHLWLLIGCYFIGACFFVSEKVIAPKPMAECRTEIQQPDGTKTTITFACKGKQETN